MIASINPFTGELIKSFKAFDDNKINDRISAGDIAYNSWKRTTFQERSALIKKAAAILRSDAEQYAALITLEMGKPIKQSRAEIEKCAVVCEFYAENAEKFLADEIVKTEASKSFISYAPIGVVLAIMPWNFPFWQVFRFAAPTLMAGNTGLLKHASNVPQCALAIENIFTEAGFPKGVFQTLLIGSEKIEQVIKNKAIKAVTLTGSEQAGSQVAALAGKYIKKTVLELGGSDPFIVFKDADISKAAKTAVISRLINAGQSCISAKRFIVEKEITEKFIEFLTEELTGLKVGNPNDDQTDIGPLARKDLVQQLQKQVDESVKQGAEIYYTLTDKTLNKGIFSPVILKNVKPGMPAFDEELFGPVFSVITAKDEAEAIHLANESQYALGASLWIADTLKGEKLAREIEAGMVFINDFVRSDIRLPFGGIKNSGYGRELSYLGIREFTNTKSVVIA